MKASLNRSVAVLGTGSYLPERVITNDVMRGLIRNYDESSGDFATWVDRVTHITERRYIAEGETAGHMGAEAAKKALDMAGVKATDLDLIIHASFTPSVCVPGDHVIVADRIGAKATGSFTLTGACAGSVYGLALAYGMLASGAMKRILVTGSETISPTMDYGDPLTTILFGDGAGAVVLGAVGDCDGGLLPPHLGFEYNVENITMDNANLPFASVETTPTQGDKPATREQPYLTMRGGPSVLRNAVNTMSGCVWQALGYPDGAPNGDEAADIRANLRVVPHQANGRIVDGLTKKIRIDPLKTTKTIYKVGNISAASNVIALDYAMRHGNMTVDRDEETGKILAVNEVADPIRKGELIVMPTIGAGYLFGAFGFVHAG